MHRGSLAVVVMMAAAWPVGAMAQMKPLRLRCEYMKNPMGIDVQPRLSWALSAQGRNQMQTSYQILVASSERTLQSDHGDLWDSGKVDSKETLNIEYAGKPLISGQTAYWKVRAWDASKHPGPYSEPARWEMGLLRPTDWQGKWICDPRPLPATDEAFYEDLPAPLFRKEFAVKGVIRRARAYVSGLGYYEMSLNGKRVGDHVLDPAWTTYSKRVLYSTYDVTSLLKTGPNAVGVTVGNGWFNPLPMRFWGWLNLREHLTLGRPRTILQLNIEYEDGSVESVFTDESWRLAEGPIVKNSIYLGEVYDARREIPGWDLPGFNDSSWKPAAIPSSQLGELHPQPLQPIRKGRPVHAVAVTEPKPGVFIFDMGQNFAGWVTLRTHGEPGQKLQLRFGELLHPDGTLNVMTSVAGQIKSPGVGGDGAPDLGYQADVYYCRGGGEESYTPRFTWHGFRYVELTGATEQPALDAIDGVQLHSDVEPVGTFSCSNELFNRIQEMSRWTLLNNMFSVQSDCPHRERFGYGGDIVASSEYAMLNLDMAAFYANAITDFTEAARPNGGITETAPFVGIDAFKDGLGGGAGPIGWGTVYPVLTWQLYQYYGDKRLMTDAYPVALAWLQFLDTQARDLCIERGLGDHETIAPKDIPLTSTAFYYLNADMFSRIARLLGHNADADRYMSRAASIKAAFNQRFLDAGTGKYGLATQACQAFALALDLVPPQAGENALKVLLEDITAQKDHLTTGIFGTRYMLMTLSHQGKADVAYRIVDQRDFPGWGYMLEKGATTLWEHWEYSDNVFSHDHPMFGSVSEWFFKVLGGIQPDNTAVGFNKIVIAPAIVPGLTWVKTRHESLRGPIVSEWAVEGQRLKMHVVIPANTTALVHVPSTQLNDMQEGDRNVQQTEGLKLHAIEKDVAVFSLGSGDYSFSMPWPPAPPAKPIPGIR